MGHLSIVNQETLQRVLSTGCISTRGDVGRYYVKTVADIFSDILAARKGDSVFPWIVKGKRSDNVGFLYEFRVKSEPIFVFGDEFPVKLPVERKYIEYKLPLGEEEALDLFSKNILWNAIGKKSLGRGRGFTHQTPQEDEILRERLGSSIDREMGPATEYVSDPLTVNLEQGVEGPSVRRALGFAKRSRLRHMRLCDIRWTAGNKVIAEKVLEAWVMENIDKVVCRSLSCLLPEGFRLSWFGNYLPFGVTGRNMDIVLLGMVGKKSVGIVIELKKDGLRGKRAWGDASDEVLYYSKFISRAIFSGKEDAVFPVIICHSSARLDSELKKKMADRWRNQLVFGSYEVCRGAINFAVI